MGKKLDLTGDRYGRLTVIKEVEQKGYVRMFLCKCDCGNEKIVRMNQLRSGDTKSCGCLKKDYDSQNRNLADISGQRFNNLVVQKKSDSRRFGAVLWKCRCDCGKTINATHNELRIGKVKSCGCMRDKRRNAGARKFLESDRVDQTRKTALTSKLYKNNSSGHKGVTWSKDKKRWKARITINGNSIHLGYFKDKNEAVAVRKKAEEKYHKPYLEEKEMNKEEIKKWIDENLIMQDEARAITGQSVSAFNQSVQIGRIKPFVEFGEKRKTRIYLKSEIEEYAKNKRK